MHMHVGVLHSMCPSEHECHVSHDVFVCISGYAYTKCECLCVGCTYRQTGILAVVVCNADAACTAVRLRVACTADRLRVMAMPTEHRDHVAGNCLKVSPAYVQASRRKANTFSKALCGDEGPHARGHILPRPLT